MGIDAVGIVGSIFDGLLDLARLNLELQLMARQAQMGQEISEADLAAAMGRAKAGLERVEAAVAKQLADAKAKSQATKEGTWD